MSKHIRWIATLLVATACTLGAGRVVMPVSAATTSQITNGGFELGRSPWTESTANGLEVISNSRAHAGAYSAWLCGYNNCNDQIAQTVNLPTGVTAATLTYWLYESTAEVAGAPCNDTFRPSVRTSAGIVVFTTPTTCNGVTGGWVQRSVDLTSVFVARGGQAVQIAFTAATNATSPTDFFIDDVALSVTAGTTVTSTPVATRTPGPTSTPAATSTPRPVVTPTATAQPTSTSSCPSAAAGSQQVCTQYMLNILNQHRAHYGIAPLILDGGMSNGTSTCVGAYGHSVHMAQTNTMSHDQFPADVCYAYSTAGENVGYSSGTVTSALTAIDNGMMGENPNTPTGCATLAAQGSTNHACNILNAKFTRVGIGIYQANGLTWLTEDFAG